MTNRKRFDAAGSGAQAGSLLIPTPSNPSPVAPEGVCAALSQPGEKTNMETNNIQRRKFLKVAGAGLATTLAGAPYVKAQSKGKIKWRLQTYAGAALGEHVIKKSIDEFNQIANGEMEVELYYADQLVPTSELFSAMQKGTIDAVQSDDDSMSSPADVAVFGGYFPFATTHSLDVPALFHHWGLDKIWKESYDAVKRVS